MIHLTELLPSHITFPHPTTSLTIPLELVGTDLILFVAVCMVLCFVFVTNQQRQHLHFRYCRVKQGLFRPHPTPSSVGVHRKLGNYTAGTAVNLCCANSKHLDKHFWIRTLLSILVNCNQIKEIL